MQVSKYNNWFDIFLQVGDKKYKLEKTKIHVFRWGVNEDGRDAAVFYNNHRDQHSSTLVFIGE